MKSKTIAKLPRRAAGLVIQASLEPRTDSGVNPAADIFRRAKEGFVAAENESETQSKINRNPAAKLQTAKQKDEIARTSKQKSANRKTTNDENRSVEAFNSESVSVGGETMRVVSLQPPRARKSPKTVTKPVSIAATSTDVDKRSQLFERTKAEELYALLHELTIGAANPCASVRVRRSDLMAGTNIKTRITLDLNLKRLEENGLIKIESRPGEQEGNIYTVFEMKSEN